MAMVELNKDTFANEIANNEVAAIEFYSDTCSVCQMLMPVLEEMSNEQTKVKFFKL